MEMTRDFIRETVKSIKTEKDKIKSDLMTKFTMLESMLASVGANIENSFRMNFPHNAIMPMVVNQGTMASLISAVNDCTDLLQGDTEVITTFKRHIEFLKLVADPIQRERLDKTFKKYFIYWDNYYYSKTYSKELSADGKTTIPNPVMSLDKLSNIFGYNVKNNIKIGSSDSDVWGSNAPVTYSYNNNMNMFDIVLDNSLQGSVRLSTINNCPELDINIRHAINRVYKSEFGFDYLKFEEVNNQFMLFLEELLTAFLKTRYEDWSNIKRKEYEYGDFDLVYDSDFKFSAGKYNTAFQFIFKYPDDQNGTSSNRKTISIKIEDHHSDSVDKIKIKLDGVYQSLNYSLLNKKEENSQVTFDGYTKTDSSRDTETVLRYYGEDYKLFVLYYGGQLLAKKDDIMLRFNNSITNRLAEQKGKEAINGTTV